MSNSIAVWVVYVSIIMVKKYVIHSPKGIHITFLLLENWVLMAIFQENALVISNIWNDRIPLLEFKNKQSWAFIGYNRKNEFFEKWILEELIIVFLIEDRSVELGRRKQSMFHDVSSNGSFLMTWCAFLLGTDNWKTKGAAGQRWAREARGDWYLQKGS